ncbi:TonB-dependent receptor plug domain-containing protein [Massilia aerilata]|uniref:TonB-dependent receptor plug domain-containing protein n=1 Tax=Massilia aerilata TaxID=453817 RepID=A0ABW0RQC8_9BURK
MSVKHSRPNPARALLALGLIASVLPAAQAQQNTSAQPAAGELQSVVVTGTRSLNRRTLETESPVDVISSRELLSTGSSELATVLSRLLPSMNFPRPVGADASDAVRPAQLRGLSPDQTLVLVNGKRRHTSAVVNVNGTQGRGSAPVDLNAIPLAAIDHIEVLRDGAAAQYGSDAIAGVVNVILKKGADGGEAEIQYGEYDKGDGEQTTVRGSTGFKLGDKGWVRVAVEAANRNPTNRAFPDPRPEAGPRQGTITQRYGDPDSRPRSLFLNSQVNINENLDWYAFANYGERRTSSAATWRLAGRSPLYPEGFLPLEDSKSTDASLVTGLRGELAGWRWDASLNHGRNRFILDVDNTTNLSTGFPDPGQTSFHAGKLATTQEVANLDVARDIPVAWMSGPLTVALGAEARYESYEISAGEPNSYFGGGAQGFSGFRPENAGKNSRNNQSLYLNLEGDITKQLSGSLAVRHERYSDFGNTTSGKVAARYALTPQFALRGTFSNGFRAPSLAQEFYTITTTNFLVINGQNTPIETGTFPVDSPAAQALGAQPLKPERARNLSFGAQWQPIRNWTTTVDLYRIDIDDRVIFSSNLQLSGAAAAGLNAALQNRGIFVGAARYFTNAVDTRTRGVDVVSTWRMNLAQGARADFTLAYNHNDNEVRHVAATPAVLANANLVLADRQTVNRLTVGSPKDKLTLSGDYTRGTWSGHANVTRYGKFTVPQNNVALDQTYDPQWVLDLSASVRVASDWRVTLGIDNVTNRYPAQVTSNGNLNVNGTQPYSVWAPNGFNGRFFYGKVGYTW